MNILIFLYTLLVAYWSDILLVIVVAGALAILYKKGKKDLVKSIVKTLVVKAQIALGSTTNTAKYNLVIATLYEKLPLMLRLVFTKAEIDTYIKDSVTWLNSKLEDPNVNLLSYAEEATLNSVIVAPVEEPTETVVITPITKYVDASGNELVLKAAEPVATKIETPDVTESTTAVINNPIDGQPIA